MKEIHIHSQDPQNTFGEWVLKMASAEVLINEKFFFSRTIMIESDNILIRKIQMCTYFILTKSWVTHKCFLFNWWGQSFHPDQINPTSLLPHEMKTKKKNTHSFVESFWLIAEAFWFFYKFIKRFSSFQNGFYCVMLKKRKKNWKDFHSDKQP